MRVFFDSSAFAKRYILEPGSVKVQAWCERASELALAVIAVPELISAFCRLRREGRISPAHYRQIKHDFMHDIRDALICEITPAVVQTAVKALESQPLRGMDALHLGAASACEAAVFVSADARQCHAAEALGLKVVKL